MKSPVEQKYRSWVEVDLDHFSRNWNEIKRLVGPDVKILQAVKADAYGHGAIEISNIALKNGVAFLGTANADEGVQLRVSGINAPIIILSPSMDSEINDIIKYNLIPSVSDIDFARKLQDGYQKADIRAPIHIEVDTGMGRGGTMYNDAFKMIQEISTLPNIIIEGVFTHLAVSEVISDYNERQWRLFKKLLDKLEKHRIRIPLKHMSNSGAILNYPKFHLDMVRPGIMSYGVYPSPQDKTGAKLWPVMSFKTRIILIKEFPKGFSIGYGRTYITGKPSKIATLPVGYGDGYGLILSNQGEVLIRGEKVPIVGRISMDMCTVDVTHIRDCQVGDEAVLMGCQGDQCISADDIAARLKTISYEILCALGKRAPRIFLHKGKADIMEPRLKRVFIPDEEKSISRIDNIIRSCFQTRARNVELGDAIYYEMFETLFGKEDRMLELRTNFRYDIKVENYPQNEDPSENLIEEYFKVTTHIEYVKTIRDAVFMIGCAKDNQQLAAFFEDKRCEYRWLLNQAEDFVMERDFKIQQVRIDDQDVPIIRAENTDRGYEVWCGGDHLQASLNKPVKLAIDIVSRKLKNNNILSVYLVYPTRGIHISFNYAGTNMRNVREVSFFAGKHPHPEITKARGKSINLKLNDGEWIFPTSGVTFVWDPS
ncbi:MAG: alanine racemase [Deltaproteobacteria bacterium]|nr:alanine racemase [Deltaproteobacteria bacterium]